MPKSKHRRKPGVGKSMTHPGRRPPRPLPVSAEERAGRRFHDLYNAPFHLRWGGREDDAGYMLGLAEVFNPRTGVFQTVSKAKLFAEFLEPLDEVIKTVEDAEAALRFLILERMVEVGGDVITVHPRFPDMFTASLAFDDLARLR